MSACQHVNTLPLGFYTVLSKIRHEDFLLLLLRHARITPPGFGNGLDWRALVESRPPNIGKLR